VFNDLMGEVPVAVNFIDIGVLFTITF